MKKVLIVSPHFPPINAPDHQRVRMSLPYFGDCGWEPTVLCVDPNYVSGCGDELLARTVPEDVRILRVPVWREESCRKVGFGHLSLRSVAPFYRAGRDLLRSERFDLVFFSTTMFTVMTLGRLWLRKLGVPFVLDIQDPWWNYDTSVYDRKTVPGSFFKYRVSQWQAKYLEGFTVPHAAHVISVSPGYVEILRRRYPSMDGDQFTVIPFGAPERDFELLPTLPVKNRIFDPGDGVSHWLYVGRGGPDLFPGLRELFAAVGRGRQLEPKKWRRVRLHFVGTSYSPEGLEAKVVEPLAVEMGLGDMISEHPLRLPYFEALKLMLDSDGLLVVGSSDRHYNPSKLFPCMLAKKPVLAVLHESSAAVGLLSDAPGVRLIRFGAQRGGPGSDDSARVLESFRCAVASGEGVRQEWPHMREVSARKLAEQQCEVFMRAVERHARKSSKFAHEVASAGTAAL
jgi:hypothetical protein